MNNVKKTPAGWHWLCQCLSELDAEMSSVNLIDSDRKPLEGVNGCGAIPKIAAWVDQASHESPPIHESV